MSGIGQDYGLGALESHTQVKPCIVSEYNFLLIAQNGDDASDKSSLALTITLLQLYQMYSNNCSLMQFVSYRSSWQLWSTFLFSSYVRQLPH